LLKLYLDTSAVLKRYLAEAGTDVADEIFDKAEAGELVISVSLWNIGEVLGVLDAKRRQSWIDEKEFKIALTSFAEELVKLIRLKTLEIVPILTSVVTDAWNLVLEHHVYEADALQIATCFYGKNHALVSGDEKLVKISRKTGLQAFNVTREGQELLHLLS